MLNSNMFELTPYRKKFLKLWFKNFLSAIKIAATGAACGILVLLLLGLVHLYTGIIGLIVVFALTVVGAIAGSITERQMLKEELNNQKLLDEIKYSEFKR